jgi:formyltetrahydrofolate hydrolase
MTREGLILKIDCPDQPGLVARIAGYVSDHHGNLVEFNQFADTGCERFFARLEIETSGLDAGPIIEQEVERVQHYHSVQDLIRLGRDCERSALAKGIRYHVHDRIILDGHRAIVFPD